MFSPGGVGGDGGHVLDPADLHAVPGQHSEGGLGAWSGGLGVVASAASEPDVQGGDLELLAPLHDVQSGQHSGVGRGLLSVGLDLHAAGDSGEGLPAGDVGHVDEGVVPGGQDVADGEDVVVSDVLGTQGSGWHVLGDLGAFLSLGGLGSLLACLLLDGLWWGFWFSDLSHVVKNNKDY